MVCIYTYEELPTGTQKEHILQNFTGATWVSDKVSCNRVQNKFGLGCDREMEESFRCVRNIIGACGDRRNAVPIGSEFVSQDGHKYLMKGGDLILREPVIGDFVKIDDNTMRISVEVGRKEDLKWARHLISQRLPKGWSFHEEVVEKKIEDASNIGLLKSSMRFGGIGCLKGVLKSCFNLLGVNNNVLAGNDCFDNLRKLLVDDEGVIDSFCRMCKTQHFLALEKWGQFDHLLFVYSKGHNVYGFARLYGQFMFSMRLTDSYIGAAFKYGYHVDPFERHDVCCERNPSFKVSMLPRFEDQPLGVSKATFVATRFAFLRLLKDYYNKPFHDGLSAAVDRVFDRHRGEMYVTEAMVREVVDEVMKFVHPYVVKAAENNRVKAV